MMQAVIFDCFGVLMIDARTSYIQNHPLVATELADLNKQADAGFIDREDQVKGYSELTNEPYEEIEAYLLNEHQVNMPLVALIKELKSSYQIGMISNLGRSWYDSIVPKDVRDLFEVTIISGEVGMVKPYPEIFEHACEKLNISPAQAVFIDDLLSNCEGAKAVGMSAIQFLNTVQVQRNLAELGISS